MEIPANLPAPGIAGTHDKPPARTVILEGFRCLKAAGMRVARVSTPCFNAPAQALYTSCGFKQVDAERTYIRKIG